MTATESNVVCGKCGEEVSAFITECPYCGARLRDRAPKLERRGDEIAPREPLQQQVEEKVVRLRPRRRLRLPRPGSSRPWATIVAIAASVALLLVAVAGDLDATALGGIAGPVDLPSDWWRCLTAPFVYDDVGYLFVASCGIAIFGIALESRVGHVLAGVAIVACGTGGLLIGTSIGGAVDAGDVDFVWGGNGVALGLLAAWAVMRYFESRRGAATDVDLIGAAVCSAVLILLSVVIGPASIIVGLSGAFVGALLGLGFALLAGSDAGSRSSGLS